MVKKQGAESELRDFLSLFTDTTQSIAEAALLSLSRAMPGAYRLVYDNYNALVIAFSPTTKTADCHISVAVYPRWVNLFFAKGGGLPDPEGLLQGSGKAIRHVVLRTPQDIDQPNVKKIVNAALVGHEALVDPGTSGELVIKAVAKTRRPRQ